MALLEMTQRDAVTHITMNAPERLNALSDEMIAELHSALDQLAGETETRVIILSGSGKAFCAGHDLRQMTDKRQSPDGGAAGFKDLFDRCTALMARIQSMPQPVIAQVHGIATAAGCQLVATCDLAVATDDCKFGVNGVNIGLFCSTPMVAVSRAMPRKHVFEMLTTGSFIPARKAVDLGLINRAVPADQLAAETLALAQQISGKLGAAVKIGKEAFYRQLEMPLTDAYAYTGDVMVKNMMRDDTAEGVSAFLEKRPPDWEQ